MPVRLVLDQGPSTVLTIAARVKRTGMANKLVVGPATRTRLLPTAQRPPRCRVTCCLRQQLAVSGNFKRAILRAAPTANCTAQNTIGDYRWTSARGPASERSRRHCRNGKPPLTREHFERRSNPTIKMILFSCIYEQRGGPKPTKRRTTPTL